MKPDRERQAQVPCPACGSDVSKVVDVRPSRQFAETTRRRRKCETCGQRFTTFERLAFFPAQATSTQARMH